MTEKEKLIVEAYHRLSSVWKVGEELGISGQSVHEILTKLGEIHKMNYFSNDDKKYLLEHYSEYREANNLNLLAEKLGRTKQFICRKAKELGLTDIHNPPKTPDYIRSRQSERMRRYLLCHPHPKGYSGHKHSLEARKKISVSSRRAWKDPDSVFNSDEFKQRQSDNMFVKRANGTIKQRSNRKEITCNIGGKEYHFLSSWEHQVAILLENLKTDRKIHDWSHESDRFVFHDVKRGIRSYLPDFKIINKYGILYIEVKGWKMPNGMKRIQMFRERYPEVKLFIIDEHEYKTIISQTDYLWRRAEQIQRL